MILTQRRLRKITVFTNSKGYNVTGVGENKYHPENIIDAQFSIPYTVATAALNKKVFIDDFTEASIKRRDVLELAQKVKAEIDPQLDKIVGLSVANRVELENKRGEHYSEYVEFIKGHPKNPMTMAECIDKFQECVRFSARPLESDKVAEVGRLVSNLEEVDDVRRIVDLLVRCPGEKESSSPKGEV